MFCPKCGNQVDDSTQFCPKCGTAMGTAPTANAVTGGVMATALKKTFAALGKKPMMLWGLSLLTGVLEFLAVILCLPLPIVYIPIVLTLQAGMAAVYLDAYLGAAVNSEQMFSGFKNFKKVAPGMAWQLLWVTLWGLIPVVGFVFAIIKTCEYAFTPYLLLKDETVTPLTAIKKSQEMTKGYRGQIFLALFLPSICVGVVGTILGFLGIIPFVGILFGVINFVFSIAVGVIFPLFMGILQASIYVEVKEKKNV